MNVAVGEQDRHGLGSGSGAHPGLQAVQADAVLVEQRNDVDEAPAPCDDRAPGPLRPDAYLWCWPATYAGRGSGPSSD
jgi:hypothetical protein